MTRAESALLLATTRADGLEVDTIAAAGRSLGFATPPSDLARALRLHQLLHRESAMKQLQAFFPRASSALGENLLSEATGRYLAAHPCLSPLPREIRSLFPEFVASAELADLLGPAEHLWLSELIRLESARLHVDEARADLGLRFADLRRLPSEQWGELPLSWQTSVQRIDTCCSIEALWDAEVRLRSLRSLPPPESGSRARAPAQTLAGVGHAELSAGNHHVLVWRKGVTVMQRELDGEEALLFDELELGGNLEELCLRLGRERNLDEAEAARQAVAYVRRWSNDGCLNAARRRTSLPACMT